MDYTAAHLRGEPYSISDTDKIPKLPGCYIYRNKRQEIIYIGKSKSLYHRVRQYFYHTDSKQGKLVDLLRELHSIEIIITDTETNALILECQLIKKYQPKYNSQLKKSIVYPYIRINLNQAYPSITITDAAANDGCKYYGCFYSQNDAIHTLELINSIWQTPVCCKDSFTGRHRPCLNYHLKKCCAPCGNKIGDGAYQQKIMEILKCLNGSYRKTNSRLKKEMELASKDLNFEKAARLRDDILGLDRLKGKQKRLYTNLDNRDVYMFFSAFQEECFSLFFIRNGTSLNREDFSNIHELDRGKLEFFVNSNISGRTIMENGTFLTSCLLEIRARKLFIPVTQRLNHTGTLKKLEDAYKEFILF